MRIPKDPFSTATQPHVGRESHWDAAARSIDQLESELRDAAGGVGRLGDAGLHHFAGGGKRLRARLALAAGLGVGCRTAEALPIAVAVELLHNASLVHDDLQDADRQRRGELAVWAKFDKPTALLLGDALLARAFGALARLESVHLGAMTRSLADCVAGLAAGQVSDGTGERPTVWTIDAYEALARAKTGLLFALPCELACTHVFGDEDPRVVAAGEAFSLLGVAFQIFDDLADVAGSKGRAVGSDLRCKRFSAVVLHHRLALAAQVGPRPRSTTLDDVFAGVPIEKQAEMILAGPGIGATVLHQDDALRRAGEAARTLPQGMQDVLRDIASEVRSATNRLVESRPAKSQRRSILQS